MYRSIRLQYFFMFKVVEGDGLPPVICTDCEGDLEKCFEFRGQVRWADVKLREGSVSQVWLNAFYML